jgi:hypothetical protein
MEKFITRGVSHFASSLNFLLIRKSEMESHCKEKQRTNSMELSPSWQATAEIPSILWNSKGPYRVHRSPPTTDWSLSWARWIKFVTTYPISLRFISILFSYLYLSTPITVAARSKAWTVFVHSNTGIVASNPIRGMDVCVRLFCVCVVMLAGTDLASGWSLVQRVLPSMYGLRNWKSGQCPQGLYSHR